MQSSLADGPRLQFNIDSAAFGPDPNQAFGGYGAHDHGAFAYDGSAGAYGSMGGTSRLYGVNSPILQIGRAHV